MGRWWVYSPLQIKCWQPVITHMPLPSYILPPPLKRRPSKLWITPLLLFLAHMSLIHHIANFVHFRIIYNWLNVEIPKMYVGDTWGPETLSGGWEIKTIFIINTKVKVAFFVLLLSWVEEFSTTQLRNLRHSMKSTFSKEPMHEVIKSSLGKRSSQSTR